MGRKIGRTQSKRNAVRRSMDESMSSVNHERAFFLRREGNYLEGGAIQAETKSFGYNRTQKGTEDMISMSRDRLNHVIATFDLRIMVC